MKKRFLILVTIGGIVIYIDNMLVPPLLETFQAEFLINNFQAGLLMTSFMAPYAIAQIPSGLLGGKFGRKNLILFGLIGLSFTTFMVSFSTSYNQILILRILFGFFAGNYFTPVSSMIAQVFSEKERGFAQGFLMIGIPAGTAIASLIAMPITLSYSWRTSFLVASIPGFIISILFYFFIKDKRENTKIRDQFIWSPRIFLIGFSALFTGATVFGFLTFFPKFLTFRGLSIKVVTLLFFTLSFSGIVSALIFGKLSDMIGRFKVIFTLFILLFFLFIGFLFVPKNVLILFLLVILMGMAVYGYVPPLMAFVSDLSPIRARGFWLGYLNTMAFVGASIGSAIGGIILDHYTYSALFLFFIAMVFIALIIYAIKIRKIN